MYNGDCQCCCGGSILALRRGVALASSRERPGVVRRAIERSFSRSPRDGADQLDIIAWWEVRRPPYNAFLVVLGIPSFILFLTFMVAAGGEWAEPMALIAAPFLYNVCYTAGWVCELLLRAVGVHNAGPTLLKLGVGLTALLITLPAILWGLVLLGQAFAG